MINLATTDKVQIGSSAAANLDCHASGVDMDVATPTAPVITPRNNLLNHAAASVVDLFAAPSGANDWANVQSIHVRNKHATVITDASIYIDRSATDYEIFKATLNPGDVLEYEEELGFYVVTAVTKLDKRMRVSGSDYVNATTSFTDITGLTCPVEAGKHYNFMAHLFHIENASTTGARFAINGPASPTGMRLHEIGGFAGAAGAGTMQTNIGDVTALDTAAIAATSSAATPQVVMAMLSGWIQPSVAGTFAIRGASEIAVAAGLTVKVGSHCRLWEADA